MTLQRLCYGALIVSALLIAVVPLMLDG